MKDAEESKPPIKTNEHKVTFVLVSVCGCVCGFVCIILEKGKREYSKHETKSDLEIKSN